MRGFTLVRALVYAALFISFFLVFLPAQVLRWSGVPAPSGVGPAQLTGMILVALGGGLAIWCVVTFAVVGRGTAAPFDPPRKLVVSGPFRVVRNPIYVGALVALGGAALYYSSLALVGFAVLSAGILHALVIFYEEPTLKGTFGAEYEEYLKSVNRWLPITREKR